MPTTRLRLFAIALLLCAACPALARAQATTPPTQEASANGVITGHITGEDGKGVANVAVVLLPADFDPRRGARVRTTSDAEGYYRLARVPAGHFRVRAIAPLYYVPEPGGNNRFNGGQTVNLTAGEMVERIDLTLARGGVITGRITDADGKPVVAQRIHVVAAVQPPQLRAGDMNSLTNQSVFETDDRGVYRVYGLVPGHYLVSVGEGADGGFRYGAGAPYPRTFHPGATDEARAQAVEVTADGEATGVDITLAGTVKTYTATGRVVDADTGQPLANVSVVHNVLVGSYTRNGGYNALTDAKGEFRIKRLTPGSYSASALSENFYNGGDAPMPDNTYSDAAPFEIADADVTGLEIKMRHGASVSGVIVLDNTKARAALTKLIQLSLYARQFINGSNESSRGFGVSRINADGTFRLTALRPGKAQLEIGGLTSSQSFTLARIERNGVETGNQFDLTAGEHLTGVRVHLLYGTGTLRGQVEPRDGATVATLPPNTRLSVRVYHAGEANPNERPVAFAEVDARGRFIVEGLLGGGYDVVLFGYLVTPPARRLPDVRQSVNVADGGETNVTISYDLSAGRDKEQ